MKDKMNTGVSTRVSKTMWREFASKARKESGMAQSDVLRALIVAYVEGRVTIKPATQPIATE